MSRRFPKGWMDYVAINEVLADARIVPFKCPLPDHFFNAEADNNQFRWCPSDVMRRVPNLGLVIDLTFKNPCYYNSEEFTRNGIKYKKIACAGQVAPSDSVYKEFSETLASFIAQNSSNDKIVGVHCTHGVNRTGFIVCKYLVHTLGYLPQDAVAEFGLRRGHPLDRENYIKEICDMDSP